MVEKQSTRDLWAHSRFWRIRGRGKFGVNARSARLRENTCGRCQHAGRSAETVWRCSGAFVYNPDVDSDRVKRAYKEFVPLDFQPRKPVQPLFGAMPKTPLMLELQITQEYLGHSTHLVYLAPMWKEYLQFDTYTKGRGSTLVSVVDGTMENYQMTGMAGVANIGDDRNWCGHIFAQANWYAFGPLA